MVDTHSHLYREYYDNLDDIIKDIKKSGVDKVIVNGCDLRTNLEVLELVKKYDIVYGALGFHPTEIHDDINDCISFLENHINDNKIVAVGEIGLDYHYENFNKVNQQELFKRQLEIAEKNKKPVIVHSRDAVQDTYDMLIKYNIIGSIHAFSGSLEMAKGFINKGFYLGIGGVCTFKNAKNIVNVIENIDLAYILLETDSPYLTPEPYRGQINTPAYIPLIAKKIREIKNKELSEVISITTKNAESLFDF